MDIKKDPSKKSLNKRGRMFAAVGVAVFVCLMLYGVMRDAESVSRDSVVISTVKSGGLNITVAGYGFLRSDDLSRNTVTSNATVKQVMVRPGAAVKAGDIIAVLVNPDIEQSYETAANQFAQAKANLKRMATDNELQLLNERQVLKEFEVNYAVAKEKADAQASLVNEGTISKFQYLDISADEQRLRSKVDFLREKLITMEKINQDMVKVQEGLVAQQEGQMLLAKRKLDELTVKAGTTGMLQKLVIEPGQSVTAGQEIAMVGSTDGLIAYVKVPQNKVDKINLGDKAIINNNQDHAEGRVVRIEPVVVDNTVEVEVHLPKELPPTFKSQQNIDARIVVRVIKSALYMERPAKGAENKQIELYRVDEARKHGELISLTLGEFADNFVEIKGGAKPGQQFVISDLSNLASSKKRITLE